MPDKRITDLPLATTPLDPNGDLLAGVQGGASVKIPWGRIGGLLAVTQYAAGSDGSAGSGTWNTSSATAADVDATNLAVTFTAPVSGKVLVVLTALSQVTGASGTAGPIAWGIRQSTSDLFYDTVQMEISTSADYARFVLRHVYSGLTP